MSDDARLVQHYDRLSADYAALYEGIARRARFYTLRRTSVLDLLRRSGATKVLEVGCASGTLVDSLRDTAVEYHGVDISPKMVAACRKRYSDMAHASFAVADARRLPYDNQVFDAVLCVGMLEYAEDEAVVVREFARVLRESGVCLITGINAWSPYNAWDRLVYRRITGHRPAAIVHEYHSVRQYRNMLEREELRVSEVEYFGFDLLPPPLDRRFAALSSTVGRKLEILRTTLFARLFSGFVVMAVKQPERAEAP